MPLLPQDHHKYQLRAYLYQARDMFSADKTGLSDPYCILGFGRYSARSRVVKESICPTWDQTILIDQIKLFGEPATIRESPPKILMNFFDKDTIASSAVLSQSIGMTTVLSSVARERMSSLEGLCVSRWSGFRQRTPPPVWTGTLLSGTPRQRGSVWQPLNCSW